MSELKNIIRDIPDYPKKGIIFKDITPLLKNAKAFKKCIENMKNHYKGQKVDVIASVESRGFIFGTVLSYIMGAGFVPIRKKGKLPYKTISETYDLEYGQDTLEIHQDAFSKGDKVIIVDDVLATGGTVNACVNLIKKLGGDIVGLSFLIELSFLNGRNKLKEYDVYSEIIY